MSEKLKRDDFEDFYKEHEAMVINRAAAYSKTTHLTYDELISLGKEKLWLCYKRHNKDMASVTTLFYTMMRNCVINNIKQNQRDRIVSFEMEPKYETPDKLDDYLPDNLTTREKTLIKMKRGGYSSQEIANELHTSVQNVSHIQSKLFRKIREANA